MTYFAHNPKTEHQLEEEDKMKNKPNIEDSRHSYAMYKKGKSEERTRILEITWKWYEGLKETNWISNELFSGLFLSKADVLALERDIKATITETPNSQEFVPIKNISEGKTGYISSDTRKGCGKYLGYGCKCGNFGIGKNIMLCDECHKEK
jgi:hypothetical protein